MRLPLRIAVPDEERARTLRGRLQPFGVKTLGVDGRYEMQVDLLERNPDRVTTALHAIDTWLLTAGVPSVQVHFDGNSSQSTLRQPGPSLTARARPTPRG